MSVPGGTVPIYHEPKPRTVVLAVNPKSGKPMRIEHRCSVEGCGRLVTQGRHTG